MSAMAADLDGNRECSFEDQVHGRKRPGSKAYERYQQYKHAKTLAEFHQLGGQRRDLFHDRKMGLLKLGPAVEPATPEPRDSEASDAAEGEVEGEDTPMFQLGDGEREMADSEQVDPGLEEPAGRLVTWTQGGRSGVSRYFSGFANNQEGPDEAALSRELIKAVVDHDSLARDVMKRWMLCASFAKHNVEEWLLQIQDEAEAAASSAERVAQCADRLRQAVLGPAVRQEALM